MRLTLWLVTLGVALVVAGGASAAPADVVSATTFTVPLSGPGGSGTADLWINPSGKVCYVIDVTLSDAPQEPAPGVGNAHIHVLPNPPGAIAVPLEGAFESLGGGMYVAADCVRGDKDVVRDILANPEQYYINIHTAAFPAGAVEGALA